MLLHMYKVPEALFITVTVVTVLYALAKTNSGKTGRTIMLAGICLGLAAAVLRAVTHEFPAFFFPDRKAVPDTQINLYLWYIAMGILIPLHVLNSVFSWEKQSRVGNTVVSVFRKDLYPGIVHTSRISLTDDRSILDQLLEPSTKLRFRFWQSNVFAHAKLHICFINFVRLIPVSIFSGRYNCVFEEPRNGICSEPFTIHSILHSRRFFDHPVFVVRYSPIDEPFQYTLPFFEKFLS